MTLERRNLAYPNVLTLLVMALVLITYFVSFADLDWSWQVRTGEQIVQTGTLRISDTFSYTIHGTVLHDFEWLYEVLLYGFWFTFGIGGLKLLKILFVFTPLALLVWRLKVGGVKWHGILLSLGVAVFALTPAWNLRPLFVTTIGLLLMAGLLHDHCTGRKPLPWWSVLVMLLWANMHPGVITGQGLLFGAIAWEWINQRLKWNTPLSRESLHRLTLVGGLALAATFICPDPIERIRYTFKPELSHPIMRIFAEMEPLYRFVLRGQFGVMAVYVVAALVLLTVIYRFRHYRMWELALLAGTAFLGNFASRSMMDWLLVMLCLGAPHLKAMLAQAARADRRRAWVKLTLRADRSCGAVFNGPQFAFQGRWLGVALAILVLISLVPPISRGLPMQESDEWPVAALDHAEKHGYTGRFFGPPDYGAYVGWRLREKGLAYTDTRGFFFPPLLIEDSHLMPQMAPGWQARLDRVLNEYQTDYFLLETQGARGHLWSHLKSHVGEPLYLDEQTVLLSARQVRLGMEKTEVAWRNEK